jgi:hypothetical protein
MRRKTLVTRTDARLARHLARLAIAALALTLIPADFDSGARAKAIRAKRADAAPYVAAATGPSAVAANEAAETRGRMAPGQDQDKPTALPPAGKDNGPLAAALGALTQAKPAPEATDGLHASRATAYKAAMAEATAATDAVARAVALAEARTYLADESRSVTDDVIARADKLLGFRNPARARTR